MEETPHHIIHRLCELDLAVSELEQPPRQKGVGFRLKLPTLAEGKHEVCQCSPRAPVAVSDQTSKILGLAVSGALAREAACPLP